MTLLDLMKLLRNHLALVIALPIACAIVVAAVCWLVLPDTYTAEVSIYVLSNNEESSTNTTLNTELSASQLLANDVAELIESSTVKTKTAEELSLTSLDDYTISVTSATTTRVMTVSVTGRDPNSVAAVANQLATTVDDIAQSVMDVKSVNVVDQATAPELPSGPPRAMYTAVAFLVGLFLAIAIVVLIDMINTRIRSVEEAEELIGLPVIGRIPQMKG